MKQWRCLSINRSCQDPIAIFEYVSLCPINNILVLSFRFSKPRLNSLTSSTKHDQLANKLFYILHQELILSLFTSIYVYMLILFKSLLCSRQVKYVPDILKSSCFLCHNRFWHIFWLGTLIFYFKCQKRIWESYLFNIYLVKRFYYIFMSNKFELHLPHAMQYFVWNIILKLRFCLLVYFKWSGNSHDITVQCLYIIVSYCHIP